MTLPDSSSFLGMDYSYKGQPFVQITATTSITLSGMDVSYMGQPFVSNERLGGGSTGATVILRNAVIMGCNF